MDIEKLINETVFTDWKDILIELIQPYKYNINELLNKEINFYKNRILPDNNLIFNCFNHFNIKDMKCIIIGQDCYHTLGVPNGLCFSHNIQKNNKIQPSLLNIFKELYRTENITRINPDLSDWAKQGCLLLNMSLTVLQSCPNSHKHIWNDYLHEIVEWIAKNCENVCVMLWGNFAQKTEIYFENTNNIILKSGHPSPLNTKNSFIGCGHFSKCNKYHNIKWA